MEFCWLRYINPEYLVPELMSSIVIGSPESIFRDNGLMEATAVRIDKPCSVHVGDIVRVGDNAYCKVTDTVTLDNSDIQRGRCINGLDELSVYNLMIGVVCSCRRYTIRYVDGIPHWYDMPLNQDDRSKWWDDSTLHCFIVK